VFCPVVYLRGNSANDRHQSQPFAPRRFEMAVGYNRRRRSIRTRCIVATSRAPTRLADHHPALDGARLSQT
jgi:hypothetical protein